MTFCGLLVFSLVTSAFRPAYMKSNGRLWDRFVQQMELDLYPEHSFLKLHTFYIIKMILYKYTLSNVNHELPILKVHARGH